MRDLVIITGMCAAAILIGAWLYFYGPTDVRAPEVPVTALQQANASDVKPEAKDVTFTVLGHGKNASITERKNYAVFTEEDFADLWKKTGTSEKMPNINFDNAFVIGVFAGERNTGGYTISVTGIKDSGEARLVQVLIEKPGEGCMTTQSLTAPYQIIRVPMTGASLSHTDIVTEVPCT